MIVIVDKPEDITSQGVVGRIKRAYGKKIKIGHTGTLDPMCTGVLPILTENDTTLSDLFLSDKRYVATFLLGIKTDTQDITGNILQTSYFDVSEETVRNVLPSFIGFQLQLPPMYSAIKIGGRKLYDLARQGIEVERKAREINIYSIHYLGLIAQNEYKIEVSCSKGTYIRTLCNDIGEKLGTFATMTSLRRTESNGFSIDMAIPLDVVVNIAEKGVLNDISHDSQSSFMHLGAVTIPEDGEKYYLNGGTISYGRLTEPAICGDDYRVFNKAGDYLGLCKGTEEGVKSLWLFNR